MSTNWEQTGIIRYDSNGFGFGLSPVWSYLVCYCKGHDSIYL